MTRKRRGMRTQMLMAQRWRELGLFPHCVDAGAGRPGKDLLNTPGISAEVKARNREEIQAALRQAVANAEEGDLPIAIWRHDGQGEKSIGEWTVYMRLQDFETLWGKTNG